MAGGEKSDYGALVGWSSTPFGDRIALHVQSVTTPPPHKLEDVQTKIYLMDRNQAVQLANYLFQLGDTAPPEKKGRGFFARLFG